MLQGIKRNAVRFLCLITWEHRTNFFSLKNSYTNISRYVFFLLLLQWGEKSMELWNWTANGPTVQPLDDM
jgi:hypothetical protein